MMHCYICNKKLNVFSDYTQIMVDGKKREICTPCNRKREKEEIKKLLQTTEGKKDISMTGTMLITTGIIETILGVFLTWLFLSFWFIILVGFGVFSIYKGITFKVKSRK